MGNQSVLSVMGRKGLCVLLALMLACFVAVPVSAFNFASNAFAQQTDPALPEGFAVSAEYGDSLNDYALPGGWSWDSPSAKLSTVGSTTASATYKSSNPGYDKQYVSGYTVDVPITVLPREVSIAWGPTTLAYRGKAVSITAHVANAAFKGDSFDLSISGGSATKVGSYKATVTGVGNSNYTLPSDTSEISTAWYIKALETGDVASVVGKKTGALPNKAGWLAEVASLVAPEGYQISSDAESWHESIAAPSKEGSHSASYYLREQATEDVTGEKTVTIKQDTVGPEIKSAKATPSINSVSIAVVAKDASSGIDKYTITGTPKKASVRESNGTFTIGGLKAKTSYNFTVKVTDNAGNFTTKSVKFVTKSSTSSSSPAGGSTRPSSSHYTPSYTPSFNGNSDWGDDDSPSWIEDDEEGEGEAAGDGSDETIGWDDEGEGEGSWMSEDENQWAPGDYSEAGMLPEEVEDKNTSIWPLVIAIAIILLSMLLRWAYDAGRRKMNAMIAAEVAAQLAAAGVAGAGAGEGAAEGTAAGAAAAAGAGAGAAAASAPAAEPTVPANAAQPTQAMPTASAADAAVMGAATAGAAGVAGASLGAHSSGKIRNASGFAAAPTQAMPAQRPVGFNLSGETKAMPRPDVMAGATQAMPTAAAGATTKMPPAGAHAAPVEVPAPGDTSGIDVVPDESYFAGSDQPGNGDLPGFMKR